MSDRGSEPATAEDHPRLDDLMMAMDVVDTIRHQETLIERELGQDQRDTSLKMRLRELYASQGLEVSDRVLEQGIAALRESRFVYERRGSGLARIAALAWVRRSIVGAVMAVAILLVVGAIAWQGWQRADSARSVAQVESLLNETLPNRLSTVADMARDTATTPSAREAIDQLVADGEAALERRDADAATAAAVALERLHANLRSTYELRIVSRPGEQTGVFRIPDVNETARNYYLIVEAVDDDGDVVPLPITSEEDGSTEVVPIFGVRVPEATFDAVAEDKEADGIVDDAILGAKPRGALSETYFMAVEDGRIRSW